jgi:Sortilin, neurotensin receptor 3,
VPGIIWVGTNDGNLQVSRDGGTTWKNVVDKVTGVPKETHVSRVEPSHYDAGTCYVTFDGHRTDDHKPYVFTTSDYGETWTSIASNLPQGNVNVIREDPKNKNLLYLGTEYAFYVSLDGGKTWKRFMNGLPTVRIDDILVHPRDNDLILGTHGRSIYIMDDISALQQMTDTATSNADAVLFDIRPGVAWVTDIQKSILVAGAKFFRGQNPAQGSAISYWLKSPATEDVLITINDVSGREVRALVGTKNAGLNRVQWDLRATPAGGRGRGQGGGGGQAAAPAEAGAAPAQPAAAAQPQGARGGGAAAPPTPAQAGGGGGRGRGGFQGPPVAAGTYLVKLMIGDKVVGQKTITVEADTTFLQ